MTMINVNLFPTNLRKKKNKGFHGEGFMLPLEVIVGGVGGFLLLLVITHVGFMMVNVSKLSQHKELKKKWESIQPAKDNVDTVVKKLKEKREYYDDVSSIVIQEGSSWAEKLNVLSDSLPEGIWLRKINLTQKMIFVEGSAVSRQHQEMISVHEFTASLKKNKSFLLGFENMELGSIQRRKINTVEIADFLIKALIKEDESEDASKD
ncbi:MAG: Tfp pilus assembly protein PilN [Candidatus Omnitrophota bacterium]|jgi:Tfp pilus assembly protein PilN